MNKTELMNNVTRKFNRFGLKLQKHSPEILVVAGVIGVVTSAVMACKATTKVNNILEEAKDQIDKVHRVREDESISEEKYSEEDSKKDLAIIYIQTGVKLVKLYGPAIMLGALSIASILASNNILRKRNVALAAAYTAVDGSFKEYRQNVVDRFGEELDKELRYNIKSQKIEEKTVDENGNEKTEEKVVKVSEKKHYSDFARCFDAGCKGWTKDPEYNLMFVRRMQDYANDKLKSEGYLFLNDVYEMFGFPRSKFAKGIGWLYDEAHPEQNYVDFGIYDLSDPMRADFVNGYERTVWLDFNVHGSILNLV